MTNLSNVVKEIRLTLGLTQRQLADELDIGLGMVGEYERNLRKPHPVNLCKIIKYAKDKANLDISVKDFI